MSYMVGVNLLKGVTVHIRNVFWEEKQCENAASSLKVRDREGEIRVKLRSHYCLSGPDKFPSAVERTNRNEKTINATAASGEKRPDAGVRLGEVAANAIRSNQSNRRSADREDNWGADAQASTGTNTTRSWKADPRGKEILPVWRRRMLFLT